MSQAKTNTQADRPQTPSPTPARSKVVLRRPLLGVAAVIAAFGLLLWARLLLVTNYPRTAIATPDQAAPSTGTGQDRQPPR